MGGGVVVIMCGGKMWNLFTFFFIRGGWDLVCL